MSVIDNYIEWREYWTKTSSDRKYN